MRGKREIHAGKARVPRGVDLGVRIALLMFALIGCHRSTTESVALRADPVASAKPDAAEPKIDFGPPGNVAIVPAVPAFVHGMMDHATHYGWSRDGTRFGQCLPSGGRGDTRCDLHPLSGKVEVLSDWDEKRDEEDPKLAAAMKKRLAELDLRATSGPWAFARDLEIVWDSPNGATLRVGARLRGEAPSFPIVLKNPSPYGIDGSVHPEVIAVSPDGATLGAIAHTFHGEFSDQMLVALMPVVRVAAHAYNDAGFAHHKKGEWKRAAELFALGAAADPTFALASYNLACAYARLGDARVETTLREAIARDPEARKKARTDEDFAGVRAAAWFGALVSPT